MYEYKGIKWEEGPDFMRKGITKLKGILEGLLEAQLSSEDKHMLSTTIDNMCIQMQPSHDYFRQLYLAYIEVFIEYNNSTVLPSLRQKHDEFMLRELVKRWANHKFFLRSFSCFFDFLHRYHNQSYSLPALDEVGLTCFRDTVYEELKGKVRDAVIMLINQEREGKQIDRALLKNVLDIFVEIGEGRMTYYRKDFEDDMLEDSGAYYSWKASNWIVEDSCTDYMLKAEECFKKERDRVSHYLHSSIEQKLVEKMQNELLLKRSSQLLKDENSGCRVLLRDDKVQDLSRMCRLFRTIPEGLETIADIFKQHVTAEGRALVLQAADAENLLGDHVFVGKVIELLDKYGAHVNHCFVNLRIFHKALQEVFEELCNKNVSGYSSAELLASFCDYILKGSKKLSDEAIEKTLGKVVKLLDFCSDKDLFAEFYWEKLSRRLLFDKSVNVDLEKTILFKLKQQNDWLFTSKMEGMVRDWTLATEYQYEFGDYLAKNPNANPGIGFTVTILATAFWPTYKSSALSLPAEMVKCVEVFKKFYQTKEHRKLTWIYSLGTCNISGKFKQKTIELVVETYQAAALLLFNASDRLSYSEIKTQLNLADDDLVRLLVSLSCASYKILNKEPNTETVTPNDYFEFNPKFTDRMTRIRIPLPPVDERKRKIVDEDVYKDRRYEIEASIVRIMKSRKVLGHQQLIMECIEQLSGRFQPDIKAIKKRIEALIDRDFLERDKKNPNLFRYLP